MANTPQKSKEAVQDALASAIHEAIGIHETERKNGNGGASAEAAAPSAADLFHDDRQAANWAAEETSLPPAANDDRANISQILQALRRRPSHTPYVLAGIVSVAWAASP
jgi:hypothetical protein